MLIRRLLLLDPAQRITADQVTEHYFGRHTNLLRLMHSMYPAPRDTACDDQVVPQLASPAAEPRRPPTPAPGSSLETKVNQLQLMESKLFTVDPEWPPTPPEPANPLMALSRHDVIEHIDRVMQRRGT